MCRGTAFKGIVLADPSTAALLTSSVVMYPSGTLPLVGSYVTFTFERNLASDDVAYQLEHSPELAASTWTAAPVTFVSERVIGASGRAQVSYRMNTPYGAGASREFFRLRAMTR